MSRRRNRGLQNRSRNQPTTSQADFAPAASVNVRSASVSWRGPIPSPNAPRQYDEVVPGAARAILDMAGKQSDHRIEMERTVLVGDSKRSYLGLLAATFLSLAVIGCGTYVIMNGHDWAGAVIIEVDVVGLPGVFVYGTNARRAERVQKAEGRPKSDR